MKIVLVVGWYFPESSGGSEVYVGGLARELKALGHQVWITAPHDGDNEYGYEYDGIPVYRYPVAMDGVQGQATSVAAAPSTGLLVNWLDGVGPDLVHFHSWSGGACYWHLRRIHERGLPLFLTVHTPSPFCSSGTMWRWGQTVCDGAIRTVQCTACYYHERGLPAWLGNPLAALATGVPGLHRGATGRLKTALQFPAAVELRREQLLQTWGMCRRVIVVSEWLKQSLLLNGCPADKLRLLRHGSDLPTPPTPPRPRKNSTMRIGYLGRFDYAKGVMLLANAFCRLPGTLPVVLELKGIPQDHDYLAKLIAVASKDPRIHLAPPSPRKELREWLAGIDVLVAPSRWMETGPLVIYEAFASHVPVIGARHSGIAELVQDRVNGLLFEPHSVEDLAKTLTEVCEHPEILTRLRQGIGKVRCMREVAQEMDALYRNQELSSVLIDTPTAWKTEAAAEPEPSGVTANRW